MVRAPDHNPADARVLVGLRHLVDVSVDSGRDDNGGRDHDHHGGTDDLDVDEHDLNEHDLHIHNLDVVHDDDRATGDHRGARDRPVRARTRHHRLSHG
jgi:hypothetical protein